MAKIVQGECSASSLLECNAEPQLILCKDNTFRSGHSEVAERFDQIPGKKARHGQTCQGFQHMEPSGEHDILSVCLWTALITILLFAVLKRQATYKWHFSNLVASLRLNTFTKIDLYVWINEPFTPPSETENDT